MISDIIELIFSNLFIVIIILGGLMSFLKKIRNKKKLLKSAETNERQRKPANRYQEEWKRIDLLNRDNKSQLKKSKHLQ